MNRKYVAYAAAVLIVIALIAGWFGVGPFRNLPMFVRGADEEAPIIVKNGSMHVDTQDGKWVENGNTWSNETPPQANHGPNFYVLVKLKSGPNCTGNGREVRIDYSDTTLNPVFTSGGGPGGRARTQLAPRRKFSLVDPATPKQLLHGSDGDNAYITKVSVGAQTCDGLTRETLDEIRICSNNISSCQ